MSARRLHLVEAGSQRPAAVPHAGLVLSESVLLAAIALLSLLVKGHPGPLPSDIGIERGVQDALLPHRLIASVIEAVSTLSWPIPSVVTLAVVVAIFLFLQRWLDILTVVGTAAVTDESSYLLNQWIARPRPVGYGIHVMSVIKHYYSFPSGHVVHATAVFGLFFFLSTQIRQPIHPVFLWLGRVLLAAGIVLMPVSRVLEGEHWPSDVLGGLLYGSFYLILAAHVYLWARGRWPGLLAPDER